MSLIGNILGTISGGKELKVSENLLFDKIIGFRGIVEGVGVSTLVQNMAVALADATHNTVCVVDTSILAPSQEYLLGLANEDGYKKDLLDYTNGQLSEVVYKTRYTNVYLASYHARELPDLLSSKECQRTIYDFYEELKSFFDVVLVDLSHETSWAVTESAIHCNRIYTVMTPSITCLSLLQRSLNEAASLAVPLHKMRKVIVNKTVSDVNAGVESALKEYGLQLMYSIPLSDDIARMGVTGERIYGAFSNAKAITAYNAMLNTLMDDILEANDVNQKQMRANLLGSAVEEVPSDNVNIVGEDFETGVKKKEGFFGKKQKFRQQNGTFETDEELAAEEHQADTVNLMKANQAAVPAQQTVPVQQTAPVQQSQQAPVQQPVNNMRQRGVINQQAVANQAMPSNDVPQQNVSNQAMPNNGVPQQTTPNQTMQTGQPDMSQGMNTGMQSMRRRRPMSK
jgi:MinD-like ATPase involved in chromosome partitioning or flagellar assembly